MRNRISIWRDRTREWELAWMLKRELAQLLKEERKQARGLKRERVQVLVLQWDLARARDLGRSLERMRERERRIRERFRERYWELEQARVQVRNAAATQKNTLITLLSQFLCERARMEWVGDFYEMRRAWQEQGLAPLSINMRTFEVAIQLLLAQLRCWLYDRTFAKYWGKL